MTFSLMLLSIIALLGPVGPESGLPAEAGKSRMLGTWEVTEFRNTGEVVDASSEDPHPWIGQVVDVAEARVGMEGCWCKNPAYDFRVTTAGKYWDRNFSSWPAIAGLSRDDRVVVVSADCRGGREVIRNEILPGVCKINGAATPFEEFLLLENGRLMIFGANWVYVLRRVKA